MKKILLGFSAFALILSSCSNEIETATENSESARNEIKVSTYVPGATRSLVTSIENMEGDIQMFAYSTTSAYNFIDNYTYDGEWLSQYTQQTGKKNYWPSDPTEIVNFLAIATKEYVNIASAPTGGEYTLSGPGCYVFQSTVQQSTLVDSIVFLQDTTSVGSNTIDHMIASINTSLEETGNGCIDLNFNHILAGVKVILKDTTDTEETPSEVSVVGVRIYAPTRISYVPSEGKAIVPANAIYKYYPIYAAQISEMGGPEYDVYMGSRGLNSEGVTFEDDEDNDLADVLVPATNKAILEISYFIGAPGVVKEAITKSAEISLTAGAITTITAIICEDPKISISSVSVSDFESKDEDAGKL